MGGEKKATPNQEDANGYDEPLAQLCAEFSPTLIAPRQFDPVAMAIRLEVHQTASQTMRHPSLRRL